MQVRIPAISKSLAEIRAQVCDTTMVWFAVLAVPALSLNIYRAIVSGWRPAVTVYTAVSVAVWVCAIARKRLPFILKANVIVGLLFVNAVAAISTFGSPAGLQTFVGCTVMAAVLFGRRAGVLTLIASLAAICAAFWAFRLGMLTLPPPSSAVSGASWLSNAGGLIITSVGPIVAISALVTQLSAELARAAQVDSARSLFVANISHELRTPMTAIQGFADFLLTKPLSPDIAKGLTRITASARWLVGLLDDLLDFSKIERDGVRIENVPFSLDEVLEEVEQLSIPLATTKGIGLRFLSHGRDQDAFVGDPTRLRQVLFNLIGNAIKFTEVGAVTVTVSASQAIGVDNKPKTALAVEVHDTGIGIPSEQMSMLFQPFTQGDATITRRFGGTGLGLAISQRLMELMGGRLSATSQQGVGSCFSFTLPLAHADQLAALPKPGQDQPPQRLLRILFADDNATLRELVGLYLRARGHTIDCFHDGEQAQAAFTAGKYDAVILDLHMPVMDGIDAARSIRKQSGGSDVMIFALTADVTNRTDLLLPAGPFERILPKPINWHLLFRSLEGRQDAMADAANASSTSHSEHAGPDNDRPMVDVSVLNDLRKGLPESSVTVLLDRLDSEAESLLNQLVDAISKAQASRATELAHSLKGLLGQFGLVHAAAIAQEIEISPSKDKERALQLAAVAREAIAIVQKGEAGKTASLRGEPD